MNDRKGRGEASIVRSDGKYRITKVTLVFNNAEAGVFAVFKTKKLAIEYLKRKGLKKRIGDATSWCYGQKDPIGIDYYLETRKVRE